MPRSSLPPLLLLVVLAAAVPGARASAQASAPSEPVVGRADASGPTPAVPELEGCSDLSSGAPERLRITRAIGWSAVPVGGAIAFLSYRFRDSPEHNYDHQADWLIGIGSGLVGSGILTGSIAGLRLNRRCLTDATHRERHARRYLVTGSTLLTLGVAGFVTSAAWQLRLRNTVESSDERTPVFLWMGIPSIAVAVFGMGLFSRAQRLRHTGIALAVGFGTVQLRGSF